MTIHAIAQYRPQNETIPKVISYAEYAFCFIALSYFTGVYGATVTYFAGLGTSMLIGSLLRYLVIFTSFGLLAFRWQLSLAVAKRAVLLWVLVGWSCLTLFWSEQPEITYLSIRGLVLPVVLFALYFSSKYSLKEQVKILTIFSFIASFLSLIIVFALPAVGRHPLSEFEGAWRGVFSHKNGLSAFMSLTLVLLLCSLLGKEPESQKNMPQRVAWVGVIFIQAMILASTSKTGLFLSVIMTTFLLFYTGFRWYGARSVLLLSLGAFVLMAALTLVGTNWEPILTGIGRDPTLTGRTDIWQGAINYWLDKFWFGYGLDAFWDRSSPYSQIIGMQVTGVRRVTYLVPHSHNGYIDTALATGFVGLSLFFLTLLQAYKRAFRSAYLLPHSHLLFAACFLIYYTIFNGVESSIVNRVGFEFMLYMTVYFSLLLPERELEALSE